MFEAIQDSIMANWWAVLLILIAAYITRRFGNMATTVLVRRTLRQRAHGDFSAEDVKKRQDTVISILSAAIRVLVWLIAGFSIIGLLFPSINLAPLLAGAGVLGVAVGFGAQTVIKDFLSGLFIILENQYRVGDVVEISGATGMVEQITVRSTILRDATGAVHYIPNGQITHAINKTMGFARLSFALAVPLDTDIDKIAAIINDVGQDLAEDKKWKKKIVAAPHFSNIGETNDTSIEIKVSSKTLPDNQWAVTAELRKRLLAALKKEKIELINLPSSQKK